MVLGPSSPIWSSRPDFGLVLLTSWPSGHQLVLGHRTQILDLIFGDGWSPQHSSQRCTVTHRHCLLPLGVDEAFIGMGTYGVHPRPSPWACPSNFLAGSHSFADYIDQRCDRRHWLLPLVGKTLVCDCTDAAACNGFVLAEAVNALVSQQGAECVRANVSASSLLSHLEFVPSSGRSVSYIIHYILFTIYYIPETIY